MNMFTSPVEALSSESMPYSTKRHGLSIADCDSEPVQTPGCIQAHGAMLVLRLSDLSILQASENTNVLLGQSAKQLFGQPISVIIGEVGNIRLQELLTKEPTNCNPLFLLTLPSINSESLALDVTVHTIDNVVVLEFESTGRTSAESPDYFALVKKTVAQLQKSSSLQQFCDAVANDIRELTGLDRVMVYKFHADGHGEVLAESRRAGLPSWHGLHYPAEDIPKPAREIFTKTWIRPVPDVSDALAELVPLINIDTNKPLNMTYCALRGVSIMYTEYLRNMGVAAALTMAIRRNEQLWGLIACHHYAGPKYHSYQVRAACEFLAQVVSLQHQAAEDKEHLAYRIKIEGVHQELLAAAVREGGLVNFIKDSRSLLHGIDACGAALYYLDRWWTIGSTPNVDELESLGDWLNDLMLTSSARPLYATDNLSQVYPPAASYACVISGLLAVPIALQGRDLIVWFRSETIQAVNWGGNPHDKPSVPGPSGPRLTPRHSFKLFTESIRHKSLPWKSLEIEAAEKLRVFAAEIISGHLGKRKSQQGDLARSNEELDAFAYIASHDLKEPLRGIHQYAHQLLEATVPVDGESRHKLDNLVRLTLRMDSLLDSLLHFSRVGGNEVLLEHVDLNELLVEATDFVGSRTIDVKSELVVPRLLPIAQCDRMRCRQIFVNLLSNALKYTDAPQKRIEVGYIAVGEKHPRPNCPQGSENQTIYFVADNGIGIQKKHFKQIFKLFKRLHEVDSYGGGTGAGLTIVRKLVEQHGGLLWVDSVVGEGSTFYFTLSSKAYPDL